MEHMEACWATVRGGGPQHNKRALELHEHEEQASSKRINLGGHNNSSSRVEASTTTVRRHKKRPLELRAEVSSGLYSEATFVAGADGAYTNSEMPKRINHGYNVGETCARGRAWDAEDERDSALILRLISAVRADFKM